MSLFPFVSFQSRFVTYLLTFPRTKATTQNRIPKDSESSVTRPREPRIYQR